MSARLFSFWSEYDGLPGAEVVYSANPDLLRKMGRDHHAAATHKPDLRLLDPEGKTVATMDTWATDWTEMGV
ncbi:hypothetical protein SAMN04488117_1321 [Celeribacter baekdonensis]|uniref:Uncharacterized protein n=1 Tax=Celeribacter baekdonensis TaxID=875171 RepID=A0A1G7UZQ8_9RHOB|nr:hypothetical protein [Celeribacter baekdonensis]SDG52986.1 hypothetical protein SAMN04488117_1321 [Celeribacter baekdonensis]